ncbi:MAG TPA: 3-oxoacyl-ACP reductase family protein [Balneolales bacterium]|nr:3-oxoacyl-ACP reductase family protein [Balneolales bacterium]
MDLSGKTALVTGASRGIGKAIAIALGEMGCNVAVNYNTSEHQAEEVAAQIRKSGMKTAVIQADVSNPDEVTRLVEKTVDSLGDISILVNNAAIGKVRSFENITGEDWDETINTNLKSVFLVTQAVIPMMLKHKWGRIINLSSVAAFTGGLVGPHYTASKAGINGLTRYYAARLVKSGITVNAIAPALIETDMVKNANLDPDILPIGRFGKPEELSSVVELLVKNGFMTGQVINPNGGLHF